MFLKVLTNICLTSTGGGDVEDDDVSADVFRIYPDPGNLGETFGEAASVGMVFVEAFGRFFERDQSGGGENPGLTHSAAEPLSPSSGFVDERTRASEYRPDRRAKTFRQ